MATEQIEIDTDSVGFRSAVAMRRATLALQGFRRAWDRSIEQERTVRRARRDAFRDLVEEHARAAP